MSDKHTIEIELDHSENVVAVNPAKLVQAVVYEKLKVQVKGDLAKSESLLKEKNLPYPDGSGLTYFIDGTRGAGKSTFLRSVYKSLPDSLDNQLAQLAYIDPSRIEDAEIVLLQVLKALAEIAEDRICRDPKLRDEPKHKEFRTNFKKLAGGLSLFAKGHDQLKHLDPELFLDHGLARAGHSKDLRKHFHAAIDTLCKMLGVEALLLAFDDADTNAKHAHKVLECIRCYLDTPRLVILVTGDMELYSLLVRDQFFNSVGANWFDRGVERRKQRIRMVDHLEEQYLLKLFPVQRRLQLRPLWNLLDSPGQVGGENVAYELQYGWKREPKNILEELIRRGLRIKAQSDVDIFRDFLLKQPLRSVLQIFSRCAPYLGATEDENDSWDENLSSGLRDALRAMALSSLYKFGVDVDGIAAGELSALINAVFDLANLDGDIDTAAYLRPQPSREDLKNCFAALSADVAALCANDPAALIRYTLAGPGSVSLFGRTRKQMGDKLDAEKLEKFKQYMGIARKEDALNWARHATAILVAPYVSNQKVALVRTGVVGLLKRKPKGTLANEFEKFQALQSALRDITDNTVPVFALSLVDVSGLGSRTYASVFNILGLMERLLALTEDSESNINEALQKQYQILGISSPEWEKGGGSLDEDDEEAPPEKKDGEESKEGNNIKKEESSPALVAFGKTIGIWLKLARNLQRNTHPSAVLMGKIWTRLFYSLENVSDDCRSKMKAAELMEMFALCVINAFYIEEADHHLLCGESGKIKVPQRTNPRSSPKVFINRIGQIADDHQHLPLTCLVATCPLILGLLESNEDSIEHVDSLLKKVSKKSGAAKELLCDEDTWKRLNSVFVKGRTYTLSADYLRASADKDALTQAIPPKDEVKSPEQQRKNDRKSKELNENTSKVAPENPTSEDTQSPQAETGQGQPASQAENTKP